jgi:hypothetical protein
MVLSHASHANLATRLLEFDYLRYEKPENARLFSFFVLLPVCLSAQQVGAPTGVMGERDKSKENEVATLFESIRSAQKLGHLNRIQNRDILEEQICTVSLTGTPNSIPRDPDLFVIYKTSHPDLPSPELNRVATFDVLHPKNKREYPRYGVAVWRTKEPHTGDTAYWVGVHLYWSAPVEFFDYHFTDGIYDRKNWEKSVAPQCRTK